jgi:diguanylate cyclase (GGDEF)-like protein/PAS domain S-box-containing protein
VYTWKQNASRGAARFGWVSITAGAWALFLAAEMISQDQVWKFFWNNLQTVGGLIPPLFLLFVLDYVDQHDWMKPGRILAILLPSLITIVMTFLDFPPRWVHATPQTLLGNSTLPILSFGYGPWVYLIAIYSTIVLLFSLALLVERLLHGGKIYRMQIISLLLGFILPSGMAVYLGTRMPGIPLISLYPFTFLLSNVLIGWALLRYRLFDLAPVARTILLEKLADPVLALDEQLRVIDLNKPAQHLLGSNLEKLFGQSFEQTLPIGLAGLLSFARSDENKVEISLGNPPAIYEVTRSSLGVAGGQLLVLHDISAQKSLEAAVRSSEERYRLLVENGNDGIALIQDGLLRFVNPQLAQMLGYSSEDLEGAPFENLLPPEKRSEIMARHRSRLRGEKVPFRYTLEAVHKAGHILSLDLSVRVLDVEERPAVLVFARDVTEQIHMENMLQESREQYRELYLRAQADAAEQKRMGALQAATIESTTDGILVVALDGSLITLNNSFRSLWNLPDDWHLIQNRTEKVELLATRVKDREAFLARLSELYGHPEMEGYDLIELHDGRILERHSVPYRMDNEIVGRLWNFRDISERKRAEKTERAYRDLLEERAEETEILKQVAETLNQVLPPERALEVGLRIVAERFKAAAGWFLILDSSGNNSVLSASYRLPPSLTTLKEQNQPWGVCRCLERLVVGNLRSSDATILPCQRLEETQEFPEKMRFHVSIPVQASGNPVGMLNLVMPADRTFDETEMRLMAAFGDQFGGAVERARLFDDIQRLAITDGLTGLYNRRHFFVKAQEEFERAQRYQHPLSILMIDVDHFKMVNDEFGHATGDRVLKEVAESCLQTLRQVDIVGRYGGEEIVVLMPETDYEAAHLAAERLRQAIFSFHLEVSGRPVHVTVSVGVASTDHGLDFEKLLDFADQALYRAKDLGRNQVYLWDESKNNAL